MEKVYNNLLKIVGLTSAATSAYAQQKYESVDTVKINNGFFIAKDKIEKYQEIIIVQKTQTGLADTIKVYGIGKEKGNKLEVDIVRISGLGGQNVHKNLNKRDSLVLKVRKVLQNNDTLNLEVQINNLGQANNQNQTEEIEYKFSKDTLEVEKNGKKDTLNVLKIASNYSFYVPGKDKKLTDANLKEIYVVQDSLGNIWLGYMTSDSTGTYLKRITPNYVLSGISQDSTAQVSNLVKVMLVGERVVIEEKTEEGVKIYHVFNLEGEYQGVALGDPNGKIYNFTESPSGYATKNTLNINPNNYDNMTKITVQREITQAQQPSDVSKGVSKEGSDKIDWTNVNKVVVTDILGRRVFDGQIQNLNEIFSQLPEGLYIIFISYKNGETKTLKIELVKE